MKIKFPFELNWNFRISLILKSICQFWLKIEFSRQFNSTSPKSDHLPQNPRWDIPQSPKSQSDHPTFVTSHKNELYVRKSPKKWGKEWKRRRRTKENFLYDFNFVQIRLKRGKKTHTAKSHWMRQIELTSDSTIVILIFSGKTKSNRFNEIAIGRDEADWFISSRLEVNMWSVESALLWKEIFLLFFSFRSIRLKIEKKTLPKRNHSFFNQVSIQFRVGFFLSFAFGNF